MDVHQDAQGRRAELARSTGQLLGAAGWGRWYDDPADSRLVDAEPPEHERIRALPRMRYLPEVAFAGTWDPERQQEMYLDQGHDAVWRFTVHGLLRIPLTEQRRELAQQLHREYDTAAGWAALYDIDEGAAALLIEAGWDAVKLLRLQAMSITTAADARAVLARPAELWHTLGWDCDHRTHVRLPARDAGRLADAGISQRRAYALDRAGHRGADAMLAARAPQLPESATRVTILEPPRPLTRTLLVFAGAAAARGYLDGHPDLWRDDLDVHTATGPSPALLGASWTLWDDGRLDPAPLRGTDYPAVPRGGGASGTAVGLLLHADLSGHKLAEIARPFLHAARDEVECEASTTPIKEMYHETKVSRRRHIFHSDDGQKLGMLWEVTTEEWYKGEDGDYSESTRTARTAEQARILYRDAVAAATPKPPAARPRPADEDCPGPDIEHCDHCGALAPANEWLEGMGWMSASLGTACSIACFDAMSDDQGRHARHHHHHHH